MDKLNANVSWGGGDVHHGYHSASVKIVISVIVNNLG